MKGWLPAIAMLRSPTRPQGMLPPVWVWVKASVRLQKAPAPRARATRPGPRRLRHARWSRVAGEAGPPSPHLGGGFR